ncbi:hypothetical protein V1478_011731, partial [Vespula squamosa]
GTPEISALFIRELILCETQVTRRVRTLHIGNVSFANRSPKIGQGWSMGTTLIKRCDSRKWLVVCHPSSSRPLYRCVSRDDDDR